MPTLHRERGYRFGFFAGDRGESEHIHVSGNGGAAKIWLAPRVRIARVEGYDRKQVGEIIGITKAHQRSWLEAWREFFR